MLNSKIYVAGHSGLVGSAIIKELAKRGAANIITRTSSELDLRRQSDVEAFFESERPEFVFLAAAKVGGILANSTYKADFIYDNMMIAANVINASYKSGVTKLLNLGSSCIYPKLAEQPMQEDSLLTGSLEPTNEPYAIAKISAIKLCRYYNEQYGTDYISLMPTNLYGPADNFNLESSHVLPALMRKFHLAKLLNEERYDEIRANLSDSEWKSGIDNNKIIDILSGLGITNEAVTIWGSGEPFREFLFVDDLAEASIFLMEKFNYNDIGEFVNIGAGRDIKIKELAGLIKGIVGFKGEIIRDISKPDGTPKKLLDISRAASLGWRPATTLGDGIERTYQWYLKSQKHEPSA